MINLCNTKTKVNLKPKLIQNPKSKYVSGFRKFLRKYALPKKNVKTYNRLSEHQMCILYYQNQYNQGEIQIENPCTALVVTSYLTMLTVVWMSQI